jgi:hypothetical protein
LIYHGDANNHSQHRTTAEVPVREVGGKRQKGESHDDDDGDNSLLGKQKKDTETDIEIGNVHELAREARFLMPISVHN